MNTLQGKWEEIEIKIRMEESLKKKKKGGKKMLALQQTGASKIMTQLKICVHLRV